MSTKRVLSFRVDPELHRRLRIVAALLDRKLTEIVEEALTEKLEELEKDLNITYSKK